MDFSLPKEHRWRYWSIRFACAILVESCSSSSFHNDFDGAANADKYYRQSYQSPGAIGENSSGDCVGIVVPNVDNHIQTGTAVSSNGIVHGAVENGNEGLDILAFSSGPEANP